MIRFILFMIGFTLLQPDASAQHSAEATLAKFTELTSMFRGSEPFSCYAIVEVKHKNSPTGKRDTSTLIYREGSTYYKSKLVEHVEAPEGELFVNHELKAVSFHISDSVRQVVQEQLKIKSHIDAELQSVLDSNFESKDLAAFNNFLVNQCYIAWTVKDGLEEISFTAKHPKQSNLLSMKIRFDKNSRVRYYEYTNRDVYARDWNGNSQFRVVQTVYDHFSYDNVPEIPSKLADFLEWKGLAIKLKKHTNYKLSVL